MCNGERVEKFESEENIDELRSNWEKVLLTAMDK